MELPQLLESLTEAARELGVEVRSGPYRAAFPDGRAARGGMCMLRGRRVIVVDESAPLPDRIAVVAAALGTLDLEGVHLSPVVRATIGANQPASARRADSTPPPPPASPTPRPLARARRRRED